MKNEKYIIRRAKREDLDKIMPLVKKALIAERGTADMIEDEKKRFVTHFKEYTVCEFENEIIGFRRITINGTYVYYMSLEGKRIYKKDVSASGLIYIEESHRKKYLRFAMNYPLAKDVAEKSKNPFLYARPTTEEGEELLKEYGFKLDGDDLIPDRVYKGKRKKPPVYKIHKNIFLKKVEEGLERIKVPFEIQDNDN